MNTVSKRKYPISGVTYTLAQISQLHLGDSPCLLIRGVGVVQDSHLTEEELLGIADIRETKWMYIRTTSELIPVFVYSFNNPPYTNYFDTTPYKDIYKTNTDPYWVTPKGFPRNQED